MKILFIILDGLGDRPVRKLNNKTPLEAARTPYFDFFAKNGICGSHTPSYLGEFPTSKEGHLSLFGYDVKKWYIGRGVFEVLGAGAELKKQDVALRGNFATVDEKLKVIDRRAGRIPNATPLIKSLQGINIRGVKILLVKGVSHRVGIILRGKGLSDKISNGDLFKEGVKAAKIKPLVKDKKAEFTANVLNEFLKKSHQILKDHPFNKRRQKQGKLPANYLLVREAGMLNSIKSFEQKWGMRAACIAGGITYKGIGRVLGMKLVNVKGATGKPNTNIKGKFSAARRALKNYDFVYCHIKGTDVFSHDGDCAGKKRFIEKIDKHLKVFLSLKNVVLIITGDHSTPCQLKEHSADPVPVLVWGIGEKDKVEVFSERACKKGAIGSIKAVSFLRKLLRMVK